MLAKFNKAISRLIAARNLKRIALVKVPASLIFENKQYINKDFLQHIEHYKKTRSGYFLFELSEIPESVMTFFETKGLRQFLGYKINILENSQNIDQVIGDFCIDYHSEKIYTTNRNMAIELIANMKSIL